MRPFVCQRSLAETLLLVLLGTVLTEAQQCFWPDGSVDAGAVACGSSGASMCCSVGSQCTSGQLCVVDDPVNGWEYFRGSCTDPTWRDPSCPDFCNNGSYAANAKSQLALCSTSGTNMSFCCLASGEDPSTSCACMNGGSQQPVVVDELVATVTVLTTTISGTSTIVIQPVKTTTLTGDQPRSTGSTSSQPPPAPGATNKAALSSPQSAIASTPSSTPVAGTYHATGINLTTGMIVGIGAGSAGFVLVIASVGIIVRQLRKRREGPVLKGLVDDNIHTPEASLAKDTVAGWAGAPKPPPLALSIPPPPSRPLLPPPLPPPDQHRRQKKPRHTQQSRCELEDNPAPIYELSGMPTPGVSPSASTEVPVMLDLPGDR